MAHLLDWPKEAYSQFWWNRGWEEVSSSQLFSDFSIMAKGGRRNGRRGTTVPEGLFDGRT
jgi:hypothetical protein